jgi:trk system potassium uptake protein
MRVIVVGCGRLGGELAYRLFQRKYEVSVVDLSPVSMNKLPVDFQGRLVEGDGLNKEILHRAGIDKCDALAVVTNSDAINLVIGHVARVEYHIDVVVARNYSPQYRPLYESFGVQVISSTSWGAQRIEEMIYHSDLQSIYSTGNGEVDIYQFTVPAELEGHPIKELLISGEIIPVSITRGGSASLPDQLAVLQTGDIVHLSATCDGIESLRRYLHQKDGRQI